MIEFAFKGEPVMSSVHWVIVTFIFIGVFFIPINGQDSTLTIFLNAVDHFYHRESFSLSLP